MRYITILILTSLLKTSTGQIIFNGRFSPRIDSTDIKLRDIVNQKRYNDAIIHLNKTINENSSQGMNYFNRAVVNYYIKVSEKRVSVGVDTLIYNDCKRALNKGYENPELHYLIFSQFSRTAKDLNIGVPTIIENGEEKYVSYSMAKNQIDLAIEKYSKRNIRYIFARAIFLYSRMDEREFLPNQKQLESDCYTIANHSKDIYRRGAAYYILSQISCQVKRDTLKAISYLTDAIQVYDREPAYYSQRANLKFKLGNYRGAITDYSQCLSIEKNPEDFKMRANCYLLTDEPKIAISDYSNAISLFEKQIIEATKINNYFMVDQIKFKLGESYYYRGIGLIKVDEENRLKSCTDWDKAMNLGFKDAEEIINEICQ